MPEQFKEGRRELTTIFLGRLILSAMLVISLKAFIIARSELLIVLRFWYFEFPNSSKLAAPVPWKEIFIVDKTRATFSSFRKQTSSSFIQLNSRCSVWTVVQIIITEGNRTIKPCSKHLVLYFAQVSNRQLISKDHRLCRDFSSLVSQMREFQYSCHRCWGPRIDFYATRMSSGLHLHRGRLARQKNKILWPAGD